MRGKKRSAEREGPVVLRGRTSSPLSRGQSSCRDSGFVLEGVWELQPNLSPLLVVCARKRAILIDESWTVASRRVLGLSVLTIVRGSRPSLLLGLHRARRTWREQALKLLFKKNQTVENQRAPITGQKSRRNNVSIVTSRLGHMSRYSLVLTCID